MVSPFRTRSIKTRGVVTVLGLTSMCENDFENGMVSEQSWQHPAVSRSPCRLWGGKLGISSAGLTQPPLCVIDL